MPKLTETVTVEREVTGVIRDLVMFVYYLRGNGYSDKIDVLTDKELLKAARDFWDEEHGE